MGSAFGKKKPIEDTKVDSTAVIQNHEVIITSLFTLLHASIQKIEIHDEHDEEKNGGTLKIYARTRNSELLKILKTRSQSDTDLMETEIGLIIEISDEDIQENEKASELTVTDRTDCDHKKKQSEEQNSEAKEKIQEIITDSISEEPVDTEAKTNISCKFIYELIKEINEHQETIQVKELCKGKYEIHIHEQTVVDYENEITPEGGEEEIDNDESATSQAIQNKKIEDAQKNNDLAKNKDDPDRIIPINEKKISIFDTPVQTPSTIKVINSASIVNRTEIEQKMIQLQSSRSRTTKKISDLKERSELINNLHRTGETYLNSHKIVPEHIPEIGKDLHK